MENLFNKIRDLIDAFKAVEQQKKLIISPYLYTWGYKNDIYKVKTCMEAFKHGIKAVNIAFIIGDSCDEIIRLIKDDVQEFIKNGGSPTISFGGAAGLYMERALTEDEMVGQLRNLTELTGITSIDFDIEGHELHDEELNAKRDRIICKYQKLFPKSRIMFTLPVDIDGLTTAGLKLLAMSKCRYDLINIMTMDIGPVNDWGATAIAICEKVRKQLEIVLPELKPFYPSLGVTPMIGRNDDGSYFTVKDAEKLGQYARDKKLGLISYWSLNRDQVGTGDLSIYSQINKQDQEFFKTFQGK